MSQSSSTEGTETDDFLTPFFREGFFGAYPTDEQLRMLESKKFDYIVRLTLNPEKNVEAYQTSIPVIPLPIKDNSVPHDWDFFTVAILWIVHQLQTGKRIFIHCKGGHGRSCLVTACIIYYVQESLNARDAIEESIRIHNERTNMSLRWKGIKSPFSKSQYIFLYKYLNPICILKSYNTGYQAGFSASSLFEIEHEMGTFSNLDAAYQAIRFLPSFRDPFTDMYELTHAKFSKYSELQDNLIHTGIRRIFDHSRYAFGNNLVGQCLMKLRENLIKERFFSTFLSQADDLNNSCQ